MQARGASFETLPLTENELADWIVKAAGGPAHDE
jgi:energy-coupling factor transport system ATP-binding protein